MHVSKSPAYLVMQRVGHTLLKLHKEGPGMTTKTIIMIGLKALDGLEEMHAAGYIHRDVKPDNISVALDPADSTVYLIDFGLSSRYERGGSHVTYAEGQKFEGTPFFASLNSVKGVRPARRDDLESLGYVLLYLSQGNLPWFAVQSSKHAEILLNQVLRCREKYTLATLCQGCDWEIREYLSYCQGLAYAEKPSYDYLRSVLRGWAQRLSVVVDWKYDWSPVSATSPSRSHHCKREKKRKSAIFLNSPSLNMNELQSKCEGISPGRVFTIQLPSFHTFESSSTESSPEMPKTPIRNFDQIPSLGIRPRSIVLIQVPNEPKTAILPSIKETGRGKETRKPRSHTCDETNMHEIA